MTTDSIVRKSSVWRRGAALAAAVILGCTLGNPRVFELNAAEAPASFEVGAFEFEPPEAWTWIKPSSRMRAAQMEVPGEGGAEPSEVVFYYFGPGSGGGTEANIDRWLGQFQEPKEALKSKVEEETVGRHKVSYVQAQGTYMSGPPLGEKVAKKDYMLQGAILESERGNVFIKMTGPIAGTTKAVATLKGMVRDALK